MTGQQGAISLSDLMFSPATLTVTGWSRASTETSSECDVDTRTDAESRPLADLNADGAITGQDGSIVRMQLLHALPATNPMPPASGFAAAHHPRRRHNPREAKR